MWVMLNDSYLSVVAHLDKPDCLLVRSRIAGDIERAIPSAEVYEIESADYKYRADVPRDVVKSAMAEAVDRIDYGNFKNSVKDHKRHDAYMSVWNVMAKAFGSYGRKG